MGGGVVQQILCPLESVVSRAGLLHGNGFEADQEGRIHTARVEQDTAHDALNTFIFSFDTGEDLSGGSGSWASLPYFLGVTMYGECCGLVGISCKYFCNTFLMYPGMDISNHLSL